MNDYGVRPEEGSGNSILQYLLGRILHVQGEVEELYCRAVSGLALCACVYNALVSRKMKTGQFRHALQILNYCFPSHILCGRRYRV